MHAMGEYKLNKVNDACYGGIQGNPKKPGLPIISVNNLKS